MKKPHHKKKTVLLFVLLAVLCIGAAELAACSWFDPVLYETITAPVRRAAHAAAELCVEGARRTGEALNYAAQRTAQLAQQAAQSTVEWMEQAALNYARRDEEMQAMWNPQPSVEPSQDPEPSLPVSAPPEKPALTELRTQGGRDILTGGIVDVVYFNQTEDPWADTPYGTDTLRKYGCGPTVMAIVVATLTDEETDPALMAQWAAEHGHWASRSGSYHSIVSGTAAAYGLLAESPIEQTAESLRDTLNSGKLLVALMKPGHFTEVGHFILLRGVTPDGDILVADPNSLPNSLSPWDPQIILDELAGRNSSGAPLWAISLPQESDD